MKLLLPIAAILICISMLSCQRDLSLLDDTDPTAPGVPQSTRLTKVYGLDTTIAAPHDTTYREAFMYDITNRLSQDIVLSTDANGDSLLYRVKTYLYNGSDTFASMITSKGRSFSTPGGPGYNSKDTVFYNYNASHLQIKDSERVSANNYYKFDYVHLSPSYITARYHRQYPSSPSYDGDYSYHPLAMSGNIVSQKDTSSVIVSYGSITDTTYFAYNRSASYNQHPDPLGRVTSFIKKGFFNSLPGLGSLSSPVNLLISQDDVSTRFSPNMAPEPYINNHVDYTYVYRSDGYPLIAREHLVQVDIAGSSGTTITYTKIIFVY